MNFMLCLFIIFFLIILGFLRPVSGRATRFFHLLRTTPNQVIASLSGRLSLILHAVSFWLFVVLFFLFFKEPFSSFFFNFLFKWLSTRTGSVPWSERAAAPIFRRLVGFHDDNDDYDYDHDGDYQQ